MSKTARSRTASRAQAYGSRSRQRLDSLTRALPQPAAAVRTHLRRRLHGAQPVVGRLAVRRRPDAPVTAAGPTIPIIVANMTAVAGRRMAETVARRGGLVGPAAGHPGRCRRRGHAVGQGPPPRLRHRADAGADEHGRRRARPAAQARARRGRRRRGRPTGRRRDRGRLHERRPLRPAAPGDVERAVHPRRPDRLRSARSTQLVAARRRLAPVVDANGRLVGVLTRTAALRATLYTPAVDRRGRLRVAAAIGVNGDVRAKAEQLLECRRGRARASTPRTVTSSG